MSLEAIRQLRLQGQKPNRAILVVIGPKPLFLDDDWRAVIVRPTDEPRLMDWRPMVGLTAALFVMQPLPHLAVAVLDALQAQQVRLAGVADASGILPLEDGPDAPHEGLLRRAWELLCQ